VSSPTSSFENESANDNAEHHILALYIMCSCHVAKTTCDVGRKIITLPVPALKTRRKRTVSLTTKKKKKKHLHRFIDGKLIHLKNMAQLVADTVDHPGVIGVKQLVRADVVFHVVDNLEEEKNDEHYCSW
jgi:hypothetical protein